MNMNFRLTISDFRLNCRAVRSPLVLLLVLVSLAGCNAIGAIAYKVSPLPKTPAKYKPYPEMGVVVVENSRNPGASEIDAQQIAALVSDELRKNKVMPLVEDNVVNDLRDKDPKVFKTMALAAVGRAVGARQMVYVDIGRIVIETSVADQMVKGTIEATVRVIDTKTGVVRWPSESVQGYPVSIDTPLLAVDDKMTEQGLRRRMHEYLAISIGRLFYDWTNENDVRDKP